MARVEFDCGGELCDGVCQIANLIVSQPQLIMRLGIIRRKVDGLLQSLNGFLGPVEGAQNHGQTLMKGRGINIPINSLLKMLRGGGQIISRK